ncbi:MAG: MarR family winged helix-turn-helix transcriptional regulator [Acetobacterium sp.]
MKPEISQKDLLYLLDKRPQSLGELLAKLEKNGYITRTQSETDHRVMNIKLTKVGTEATEQEFSFDKMFEYLNEEEQMNLSCYLNRIIETIEAQLGDEPSDCDPRERVGNLFEGRFGGYPDGRRFHGSDFDQRSEMRHHSGMNSEWPDPSAKKSDDD